MDMGLVGEEAVASDVKGVFDGEDKNIVFEETRVQSLVGESNLGTGGEVVFVEGKSLAEENEGMSATCR